MEGGDACTCWEEDAHEQLSPFPSQAFLLLVKHFKSGVIPVLVTLPKCLSPALAEMHLQALQGRLQSCPLLGKFSPRRTQKEIHRIGSELNSPNQRATVQAGREAAGRDWTEMQSGKSGSARAFKQGDRKETPPHATCTHALSSLSCTSCVAWGFRETRGSGPLLVSSLREPTSRWSPRQGASDRVLRRRDAGHGRGSPGACCYSRCSIEGQERCRC